MWKVVKSLSDHALWILGPNINSQLYGKYISKDFEQTPLSVELTYKCFILSYFKTFLCEFKIKGFFGGESW